MLQEEAYGIYFSCLRIAMLFDAAYGEGAAEPPIHSRFFRRWRRDDFESAIEEMLASATIVNIIIPITAKGQKSMIAFSSASKHHHCRRGDVAVGQFL